MREELELKLQEDFPFKQQNRVESERNIYRKWGCECSSGWYPLIHDLCHEEKSKTVCENCGQTGNIRMDMPWKRTLCDDCYENYLQKIKAKK